MKARERVATRHRRASRKPAILSPFRPLRCQEMSHPHSPPAGALRCRLAACNPPGTRSLRRKNVFLHRPSHLHRFRPDLTALRAAALIVSVPVESIAVPSASPSMSSSFRNLTEPLIGARREREAPDCVGMNVRLDDPGTTGGLADWVRGGRLVQVFRSEHVHCVIPPGLAACASWLGLGNLMTKRSFLPSNRDVAIFGRALNYFISFYHSSPRFAGPSSQNSPGAGQK